MKKVYYGWWVVGGSFLLFFCTAGTYFYTFPIFFDAILRDMGWPRTQVAGAMSLGMFVTALMSPLIGAMVGRVGVRPLMIFGSLLSGVGFALLSRVSEPWHLYLYYGILASVGISGIQLVPNFTIIGKWFYRRRSTALGVAAAGIGVGGAVMAPLFSGLIAAYGWQKSFFISAVIIAFSGVLVAVTVMRTPEEKKLSIAAEQTGTAFAAIRGDAGLTFREAMTRKAFWLIAGGVFFWGWAYTAGLVHQVAFAVDMGIDPVAAAAAVGLLTAFSIVGRLGFGRLGDAIDKRYVFIMGLALEVVAFFVLINTRNLMMLYLYSALLGLGIGGFTPILPGVVADRFGGKSFSLIYSVAFFWFTMGEMVGPIYAGWLFDTTGNYRIAFTTCIAISIVAVILIYFVGKPLKAKTLPA